MSEEKETTSTEAPVGTSAPAGGKDPHRDAEREKESSQEDGGQPIKQPEEETNQGAGDQDQSQDAPSGDQSQAGPTAEEQASADNADQQAAKADYKVLQGVEFPRGTAHEVGAVIQLTEEEAAGFAEGLIEKVVTE